MSPRPLLLGHRGARAVRSIPENTFASFDRAVSDGCDGFEFDVRLTADGQAVICHDPKAGDRIIDKTPVNECMGLPLLESVLERYQQTAFLDIELKVRGLEKATVELLHRFSPHRGFLVSSFLPDVLQFIHREDPAIPLGLICETRNQLSHWRNFPLRYVIPHYSLTKKSLIDEIHDAKCKVVVWTVNKPDDMRSFVEQGVDGIISDDTRLLAQTLAR